MGYETIGGGGGQDSRLHVSDAQPDSSIVTEGDLWSKTVSNELFRATDASTFVSVETTGSGSMTTVKSATVQVGGADIVTLDYAVVFTISESPDTEINVGIREATAAQTGIATAAQITKLDAIEAAADVTDATNVAAAGAVMDSDISEGEGFVRKTGAGAYEAVKTNLAASAAPGATDDSAAGYAVGSLWIDTTGDKAYICVDATATAAVWLDVTTVLLAVANGGTGLTTITDGGLLIGDGTNAIEVTARPSSGQILVGAVTGSPGLAALSGDATMNGVGAVTVATSHSGTAHHTQSHDHSAAGDGQSLSPATIILPNGAAPTPTTEADIEWETDRDLIVVGDGAGQKFFMPVVDATSDPADVADTAADGTEDTGARKDHAHAFPSQTVDVYVPAASMRGRVTNGAGDSNGLAERRELATNDVNIDYLAFDTTTSEHAYFSVVWPAGWDAGTIKFTLYWTAASGSGTIDFDLAGVSFGDSDALDTAFGTAQNVSDTLITADDVHITAQSAAITIAAAADNEYIVLNLSRDVATDTLGVDCQVLGISIELTRTSIQD